MKTEMTTTSTSISFSSDSTKLTSLLALAAGAIAMPQTGNADIIYTNFSSNPIQVGFTGAGTTLFELTLPGTARFGFGRFETVTKTTTPTYSLTTDLVIRGVYAKDLYGLDATALVQTAGSFAVPQAYGVQWNQNIALSYTAIMGYVTTSFRLPNSGYDHQYLGFRFQDSSLTEKPYRYGWIEVGLTISNYNPNNNSGGPTVTIYGYAWDNTGAQPFMGQTAPVPEPSSAALLVFGALALGAPGLRKWRQNRDKLSNS